MADLQDPFLVSIHIIAEPGQARTLQRAADQVLSRLHPELTLFRVSERAAGPSRRSKLRPQHPTDGPSPQPALAVILFLQEEFGGEESQERLHGQLRRAPWCYHHTERVNGRGVLPLTSDSQDFFTLAPGTPLWALRQVRSGKEIVRFTVYCRHETYGEQVQLYRLLLRRRLAQRKDDFCFCVIFSNRDTEIQLSFKQLPRGQKPTPTECAIMEIRVRDVGGLVPLLPHPCTPISDVRWQTEDYDGNRILLQVPGSWKHQHRHTTAHFSRAPPDSSPVPSTPASEHPPGPPSYGRGPASYRNRRYRTSSRSRAQAAPCTQASQTSLPLLCEQEDLEDVRDGPEDVIPRWMGRSRSTFSLPTEGFGSACPSPAAPRPRSLSSFAAPVFRVNVDALVGAEETDVDTGQAVNSSSVDLTVVSAYSRPQTKAHIPRPVSAPPQDRGPDFTALSDNHTYLSLNRQPAPSRTGSISSRSESVHESFPKQGSTSARVQEAGGAGPPQSNGTQRTDPCRDAPEEEEEQEFYI